MSDYLGPLSHESMERTAEVFIADDGLANRLWDELHATNPELQKLIQSEALRLFPNNNADRAKATRFVIEVVQALRVEELDSIVM